MFKRERPGAHKQSIEDQEKQIQLYGATLYGINAVIMDLVSSPQNWLV